MTKQIPQNKLPHWPEPFASKIEAVQRAEELKKYGYAVCVIKSKPTQLGQEYYVEPLDTLIRCWESIVFRSHK